jgi:hypothetical protein
MVLPLRSVLKTLRVCPTWRRLRALTPIRGYASAGRDARHEFVVLPRGICQEPPMLPGPSSIRGDLRRTWLAVHRRAGAQVGVRIAGAQDGQQEQAARPLAHPISDCGNSGSRPGRSPSRQLPAPEIRRTQGQPWTWALSCHRRAVRSALQLLRREGKRPPAACVGAALLKWPRGPPGRRAEYCLRAEALGRSRR